MMINMEFTGTSGVQGTKITQTNRMKVIFTALVAFISVSMLSSCGSTHKMSKVEHVVLPTTVLSSPRAFPQEIADSLGWGAMYEGTLGEEEEEFRVVLSSPISPYHALRIKKTKDIEGAYVLFWEKNAAIDVESPQRNIRWFIQGECKDFKDTAQFEYCTPEWFEEPDWQRVYQKFDQSDIWTLEPADSLVRDSLSVEDQWVVHVEARVENYFRRYQYLSPDTYQMSSTSSDVLTMVSQMKNLRDATIQRDNFNVYRGYMKGPSGPEFVLCDESETWYFDGHLEDLVVTSAYPVLIEEASEQHFYVELRGQVRDQWYTEWFDQSYTRVIISDEINEIQLISGPRCPF
ncbi:hypothetical protein OAU86_01710 [Balneolaceae bacterium]|jgi:hypothetical protein|nr:hypothetical protein [Balneolaceae bacterium]